MSLHIHKKGVVFVQDVLFTAMIHFTTYMFTLQEIQASARQQQQFAVVLRLKKQFRKTKTALRVVYTVRPRSRQHLRQSFLSIDDLYGSFTLREI